MLKSQVSFKFLVFITVLFIATFSLGYRDRQVETISKEAAQHVEVAPKMPKPLLNKHATAFVKDYLQKNDECLLNIRQRSRVPFGLIDSVFNHYGLPVELKYLAVIESELKTTAVSKVGAVGPWQLMPETAQILGLKVNRSVDERRYYSKSTKAAALYLKDLHNEFGDWLLVLAAYNSGPGPVYRAIRQAGSRNFWALQYYLPAESRDHVKKFIATHYYFEGQGSVTTLTKTEELQYEAIVRTQTINQAPVTFNETDGKLKTIQTILKSNTKAANGLPAM